MPRRSCARSAARSAYRPWKRCSRRSGCWCSRATRRASPVEGDAGKLLDGEFNKSEKESPRELLLPNKPVKPGDTWKIDAEKLVKSMGDQDYKIDKSKVEATGKLVKAYKVCNTQFGVLELKVSAPITDIGGKTMFKI